MQLSMCWTLSHQRHARVDLCHQPRLLFLRNTSDHFPKPALGKGFVAAENLDAQGCWPILLRRMRLFRNSNKNHAKGKVVQKHPVLPGPWWSPKKQNQHPWMTTIHAHVCYAANPLVTACQVKNGCNTLHVKCGHMKTVRLATNALCVTIVSNNLRTRPVQ